MNIYFAYKMTAAINICVSSHKTVNRLHQLFPGNKRFSSAAIETHLAGAESSTALSYMTAPHWGFQDKNTISSRSKERNLDRKGKVTQKKLRPQRWKYFCYIREHSLLVCWLLVHCSNSIWSAPWVAVLAALQCFQKHDRRLMTPSFGNS